LFKTSEEKKKERKRQKTFNSKIKFTNLFKNIFFDTLLTLCEKIIEYRMMLIVVIII